MLRNLLRAGVLALAMFSSAPVRTQQTATTFPPGFFPQTVYTSNPYVEKISCPRGSGTGFKLQDGRWVSVNHVVGFLRDCTVDGLPIKVTYTDAAGDFALFEVPGDKRFGGLPISCQGFFDRAWYFGIGHGRGDPFPQIVAARYSALYTFAARNGWGILDVNRFVPGMSGGPVLDEWGRVVGTVNAFGIYVKVSMSRQLRDTPLCAK